jgi:ABC-type uncharacterized transport system auxiliary subunit
MLHSKNNLLKVSITSWIRICAILLSGSLFLAGCTPRRSVPARYYIIDYPAGVEVDIAADAAPVQNSCLVSTVNIYPAYSTNQIAIRENTHEIRYFAFNQWAVRPEQSLTSIKIEFLKSHNIFQSLQTTALFAQADYTMETTVYHLEIIEEDNEYHARLNLEYILKDNQTGQVVIDHRADRKSLLDERNLNLFAATVSKMFIEELGIFSNSILTDLRNF